MTKLSFWAFVLLASFSVKHQAFAQTPLEICGLPSEAESQEVKGNLQGKAQTLARLGEAELQGAAELIRNEITIGSNRSDAARELHYINYMSCVAIFSDKTLSTDQKLARIRALNAGLYMSAPPKPSPLPAPTPSPTASHAPGSASAPVPNTMIPRQDPNPVELGGERWAITVDGQTLDINFGAPPDYQVTLSGGRYGSEGKWWPNGSVSFQITTSTHVLAIWPQLTGNARTSTCEIVIPLGGGHSSRITACERLL